jgi:hypothetical protein
MSFTPLKYLLAACWFAVVFGASGIARASTETLSVLFLDEDEPGLPGNQTMTRGFRERLAESLPGRVAIYQENLDRARFPFLTTMSIGSSGCSRSTKASNSTWWSRAA